MATPPLRAREYVNGSTARSGSPTGTQSQGPGQRYEQMVTNMRRVRVQHNSVKDLILQVLRPEHVINFDDGAKTIHALISRTGRKVTFRTIRQYLDELDEAANA